MLKNCFSAKINPSPCLNTHSPILIVNNPLPMQHSCIVVHLKFMAYMKIQPKHMKNA